MATISLTAEELTGRELLDETGRDIGAIVDLYVDDDGRPLS
jgi:sporulation protein YlmC with PRC-barrel domain